MQPKYFLYDTSCTKPPMKREKIFKYLSIGLFATITAILVVATIMEKLHGTKYALANIYYAGWMIALWVMATLSGMIYIIQRKLHRRPITLCLHLSFVVILIGALVTHIWGKQGAVHLRVGDYATGYTLNDGSEEDFPFSLALDRFELVQHTGTATPMDFVSSIVIYDDSRIEGSVSMNDIFKYRGYRFYQSGYDEDLKGTTLSIAYDPWGIGITYAGYMMLLFSMILFFFERNSGFRTTLCRFLHKGKSTAVALLLLLAAQGADAAGKPQALPRQVAERFCDLHICYNGRICPMQTLAIEFTTKICGERSYEGYSAEQVLTGWFFFYDDWKNEPMIKIKGSEVKSLLGIDGDYARLTDFTDRNGYKLEQAMRESGSSERKNVAAANEKFNIISMLCTGTLLKIYPYTDSNGEITWYSLADRLPQEIPYEQWLFISKSLDLVAEKVAMRDYDGVSAMLEKIREYQTKAGGNSIPSAAAFKAEKLYNRYNNSRPLAIICLATGVLAFMLFCLQIPAMAKAMRIIRIALRIFAGIALAYITAIIGLRWFISGHIPLSNGHETMMFMAWCSLLMTLLLGHRAKLTIPFGYIICGFTLLVATIGEATPQITPLMPVLQSPLLCIHVVVIMISYTLLAFTMLNGIAAFIIKAREHYSKKRKGEDSVQADAERASEEADAEIVELQRISRLMLYPAVFLLTAGIFIGAVWANVSWGRYWGWDPKEVWALITMLIYSAALHSGSIKAMRRPMFFHAYCIVAFLSVLVTYFGVNLILGGMHSYA